VHVQLHQQEYAVGNTQTCIYTIAQSLALPLPHSHPFCVLSKGEFVAVNDACLALMLPCAAKLDTFSLNNGTVQIAAKNQDFFDC
jgi:hypothetical protein